MCSSDLTYETADRQIAVAVGNERMFARLCAVVGLEADERFASNESRVAHADELAEALEARLRAAKVPAGPINGIDEAFALAEELGMEPSQTVDGVPLISPPMRIDGERPPIRHRPPRLGEHDDDLRAWLRSAGRG